jgi:Spy/CpxP family protein refolding chaperone
MESLASCHGTYPYPDFPPGETSEGLGATLFANSRRLVGQNRPASARDYYLSSVWKSCGLSSLNEPLYSRPEAGSRILPIRGRTGDRQEIFLKFLLASGRGARSNNASYSPLAREGPEGWVKTAPPCEASHGRGFFCFRIVATVAFPNLSRGDRDMSLRKQHVIGLTIVALFLATGRQIRAQEQKPFSPALEQLRATVSERLQTVADQLGLTPQQRTKIREAHAAFADRFQALRTQRREMLQSELEAIRDVLTPEQREVVKGFVEDRREAAREAGARREWPEVSPLRDTLADRVQALAGKLALTTEQRKKIRDMHAPFAEKYRANRAERRDLVEAELKAVAEDLTPQQREQARRYIEGRMVRAAMVQSVAERMETAADRLGLSDEQRRKIRETHAAFVDRYRTLSRERSALLHDELEAISEQLTSDQRDRVQDLCEDRVVVVGVAVDPNDPDAVGQLRETMADRLRAVADRLGLTDAQRRKIREAHAAFADKYEAQRTQRRDLRRDELKALGAVLSPEQLEKVKSYIEDRVESLRNR